MGIGIGKGEAAAHNTISMLPSTRVGACVRHRHTATLTIGWKEGTSECCAGCARAAQAERANLQEGRVHPARQGQVARRPGLCACTCGCGCGWVWV